MINYQSDVIVNRPIADVFRFMKDVSKYGEWTEMTNTRLVSGNDLMLGSQVESTLKFGPNKQKMVFEVIAYEENRKIGWKTVSNGTVKWDAEYIFEPQGQSATRVVSSGQISLSGILKMTESVMAGEIKNGEAKELVKFKELAEAS